MNKFSNVPLCKVFKATPATAILNKESAIESLTDS